MTHFHIETDYMDQLGTFAERVEAQDHARRFTVNGRAAGYTPQQMAGGARAVGCTCWMGTYVLAKRTA